MTSPSHPFFSNLPLFVGLRYLRSKRRSGFVSLVSGFSFGAMALGVMALILVLSVMNGLAGEIYSRVLNVIPHAVLQAADGRGLKPREWQRQRQQLLVDPAVAAVAPYAGGYAMLRLGGMAEGVQVQGVDPGLESRVSGIAGHMLLGDFSLLRAGGFGVVIGSGTARQLQVVVGDRLRMTLPQVSRTPLGVFPREKYVTVTGIFEVVAQVDRGIAFMHLADAQKLYRRGDRIAGIRARLVDPLQAEPVAERLRHRLPPQYELQTWGDQLGSLFVAMKMEKVVVGLLLAIVIAVAAFNIVANLVLMVSEKRRDIAVLRSMGASTATVVRIFMVQGVATGLSGVLAGAVGGCLLGVWVGDIIAWFERLLGFTVFDPNVYYTTSLPSILQPGDVIVVCSGAALISLLATLYPAWRASRIQPAEALRYDR